MLIATALCLFLLPVPSWQFADVVKGPARIGCDAAHSLKCSFTNAQWLASTTAETFNNSRSIEYLFNEINDKKHNYEVGFYTFVVDRETSICVAHGRDINLVNLTLTDIFNEWNIGFSSPEALHQRFIRAAENGGDWVRYLASGNDGKISSKTSFVTNLTDRYYIGVGFHEDQLPPDPSCTDKFDSWCSFNNIRSLVGAAQAHLNAADSLENFEAAMHDLSFDGSYRIEGGFYLFVYDYDSRLQAHGIHRDLLLNTTLAQVLNFTGNDVDAEALHQQFLRAAEGELDGWTRYLWRNNDEEQLHEKIALIAKVEFEGRPFYLGAGFNHDKRKLLNGPLPYDDCSGNFSLPCSSQNSLVLSSHALAHLLSSNETVDGAFQKITEGAKFGFSDGDYYLFAYDYNNTCVAHGLQPQFVGKSLSQVFEMVDLDLDGDALHEQFREAAKSGGGWVRYRWLKPGIQDSDFEKVSFIFPVNLGGRSFYVGIGFNNQPLPISQHLSKGTRKNGRGIPCSRNFDDDCSAKNTQSVVGQALTDLILKTTEGGVYQALEDITITNQSSYQRTVDDCEGEFCSYFVMVFTYHACNTNVEDNSGCCVAHGGNATRVGMSWQDILDADGVTGIRGSALHEQLRRRADAGGGALEDHFDSGNQDSIPQKKQIWASPFRVGRKMYYVAAVDILTPVPKTCDACPDGMECTQGEDSFCTVIPQRPPVATKPSFISGMVIFVVAVTVMIGAFVYLRTKRQQKMKRMREREESENRIQVLTEQMEHQMQGIRKVLWDMPPISEFRREISSASEDVETGPVAPRRSFVGVWFWEEDPSMISYHISTMVEEGTTYVQYSTDVNNFLESSYKSWQENRGSSAVILNLANEITSTANGEKVCNQGTGCCFDIDFKKMIQTNCQTGNTRDVWRKVVEEETGDDDDEVASELPGIPSDINAEDILPAIEGQILQVSKYHSSGEWLWAIVVFDPWLNDAQSRDLSQDSPLNNALSSAINDRPMSGWIPESITESANARDLQGLLRSIGGDGMESLTPPREWTSDNQGSYREGSFPVQEGTQEYNRVKDYFLSSLNDFQGNVRVMRIERCQNIALWQSYAVKKQTVETRLEANPDHRIHNYGDIERKWLFHGTNVETILMIIMQGFNRSFAGRHAAAYGWGTYFARDASYSIMFAEPDDQQLQHMFLCRVVVGDWCQGRQGLVTPESKPNNPLELYDTAVDDVDVLEPSIFVTFHDSSAYPEYLITFKSF